MEWFNNVQELLADNTSNAAGNGFSNNISPHSVQTLARGPGWCDS